MPPRQVTYMYVVMLEEPGESEPRTLAIKSDMLFEKDARSEALAFVRANGGPALKAGENQRAWDHVTQSLRRWRVLVLELDQA